MYVHIFSQRQHVFIPFLQHSRLQVCASLAQILRLEIFLLCSILFALLFSFCDSVYALHSDYSNRTKTHGEKSQFFCYFFSSKKIIFFGCFGGEGIREKKNIVKKISVRNERVECMISDIKSLLTCRLCDLQKSTKKLRNFSS